MIRTRHALIAAVLFSLLAQAANADPESELRKVAAIADQFTPSTRFLSLYNFSDEKRETARVAVEMMLNSASRGRTLKPAIRVDETLLAFDLHEYGWTSDLWEALISDGEPYWHLTTEVATEIRQGTPTLSGYYVIKVAGPDGKSIDSDPFTASKIQSWINDGSLAQDRKIRSQNGDWTTVAALLAPIEIKQTKVVQTDGPWLNPADVAALQSSTSSRGALARADWFVSKLCEPDHYYAFVGVNKTRNGHLELLGVDVETVKRLGVEMGTNVEERGPTNKPGRVIRFNAYLGGYWSTYDVNQDNVGIKDPFRDPTRNFDALGNFDAGESFYKGPNGLWQFNLFDAQGNIQGAAPPDIAADSTHPVDGYKELIAPISCFRCHAQKGEGGLINLTYDQQDLFKKADLFTDDPKERADMEALYSRVSQLEGFIQGDRQSADAAATQATGVDWNAAAIAVAEIHDEYVFSRITKETILRELGIADVAPLLNASDPHIVRTAANNGFKGILRKQWETAFAEAIQLVGRQ